MERPEGLVTIANTLLLLLTLLRSAGLDAVPRYQGQGLRAYLQLLWGLWKLVEPPKIRFTRAVVLPSAASVVLWIAIGIAIVSRCVMLAKRGILKLVRGAWAALMATVKATIHSGMWVAYVFAVAVALMLMVPAVWAVKATWAYTAGKVNAGVQRKKA